MSGTSLRLQLLVEGHGRTVLVNTALPDDLGPLHAEYPGAVSMWAEPGTRGAIVRSPAGWCPPWRPPA